MWRSPFFTQPKCRSANSSSEEGEDVCGVVAVLYENYSQLQDTRMLDIHLDIHLTSLPKLFPSSFLFPLLPSTLFPGSGLGAIWFTYPLQHTLAYKAKWE